MVTVAEVKEVAAEVLEDQMEKAVAKAGGEMVVVLKGGSAAHEVVEVEGATRGVQVGVEPAAEAKAVVVTAEALEVELVVILEVVVTGAAWMAVEEDLVVVWVEVVMVERLEVVELQEATVVEEVALEALMVVASTEVQWELAAVLVLAMEEAQEMG